MVGLLSGMDNEDRSAPTVTLSDSNVSDTQEVSNAQKSATNESQPEAENVDNVDEVEHVKELKSILKQRGQYTFRKVKVDFDLIPKKIPYDEDDYTVEIQIIEKEPVKIKSWAALFAARKAEAEAEAAAIAEAEEALKKAEEVQKREALKKANKAKLMKKNSETSQTDSLPSEQSEEQPTDGSTNQQEKGIIIDETTENKEESNESIDHILLTDEKDEDAPQGSKDSDRETDSADVTPEPTIPNLPIELQIAKSIVGDILDTISTETLLGEEKIMENNKETKDEDESSCTESLAAERSEHLQEEHTNDDLEDISTHDDASVSQILEDSNAEGSLSQDISCSRASYTRSNLEEQSLEEASECRSDITQVTEVTSHSEDDSSSKVIELNGKKVPKKMLVTAASLVEEILSEMPKIIPIDPKNEENLKESMSDITEKKFEVDKLTKDLKCNTTQENGAQRKRREFKKSTNSGIYEHVKRSLESAAPELLETAVGVLEEIEKIVVEKVESAIP